MFDNLFMTKDTEVTLPINNNCDEQIWRHYNKYFLLGEL